MLADEVDYVVGVDTHRDEHVLAVVGTETRITFLVSEGTIDEAVERTPSSLAFELSSLFLALLRTARVRSRRSCWTGVRTM